MNAIVRDINDMTDSREMMESKPHPVVAWFLILLLLLLCGGFAWTWFGEMDITVKATGIVRPNEKVSSVKNKTGGRVQQINYQAGQYVRRGDLLYSLERSTVESELLSISTELSRIQKDVDSLILFRDRLASGDASSNLSQLNLQMLQDYQSEHQLEMERLGILRQLQQNYETIRQLTLLEQSTLQRVNLFGNANSEYAARYTDYDLKLSRLEAAKLQSEEDFREALGQSDLTAARRPLEESVLELELYKNEFILQVRTQIEELRKQDNSLELSLSKIYSDLNVSIRQGEDRIFALEEREKALTLSLDDYEIRSPADGIIQIVKDITSGELLQPGEEVAAIIPEDGSQFTIQLSLPNRDVANIRPGDQIKYHFEALPYKEYGELEGQIRLISADAVQGPEGSGSFYLVEADIENKPLYSYKGEEAQIRVGMVCEGYIITESKKILYYLLEKIDLRE